MDAHDLPQPAATIEAASMEALGLGASRWSRMAWVLARCEQRARQMLADAGFRDVEVEQVEGDLLNNYYIARKG